MPPKARITKDMIVDAAFAVVRRSGAEDINVRKVANELGCSTQPVMYHFKTVEELKAEVYDVCTNFFNEYVTPPEGEEFDFKAMSRRYLQFAREESPLFKFIFQSGRFTGEYFDKMFGTKDKTAVLGELVKKTGFPDDKARLIAAAMASSIHGYASIVANGNSSYDENVVETLLDTVYRASLSFMKDNG